jgi:xylulokinase
MPGTAVVMGGGDGPMAAVGVGAVTAGSGAYVYLGSSSWVSFASSEPLLDPKKRTMTFNHVVPGLYVPTATMQAGGGSLQWIAELLDSSGNGRELEKLVAAADTCEASGDGLYFLPHLLGERSPYWNPSAKGAFVGLGRHHRAQHLTRAVLEGVAFNLQTCVTAFREAGQPFDCADAIGGGAVSDVWLQILADVWGARLRRRSIVEEANSLGTAVTAGVGIGCLEGFGVVTGLTSVTAEFVPDAARHEAYRARHEMFLAAYQQLEPWFER